MPMLVCMWQCGCMAVWVCVWTGKQSDPKHLFANPLQPALCPILSLAVLVFTMGYQGRGDSQLIFGGSDSTEKRFSEWLRSVLGDNAEDLIQMGITIADIGTHSLRKGVTTTLTGMIAGASIIAMYL